MFRDESPAAAQHVVVSEGRESTNMQMMPRIEESATPSMVPMNKDTSAPRTRKTIGHYSIGKECKLLKNIEKSIGEGTFGKVKLGTHHLTGEKVAIKILEKDRITDVSDVERVAREIHILKLIRHPNIIQLYEIIETPK